MGSWVQNTTGIFTFTVPDRIEELGFILDGSAGGNAGPGGGWGMRLTGKLKVWPGLKLDAFLYQEFPTTFARGGGGNSNTGQAGAAGGWAAEIRLNGGTVITDTWLLAAAGGGSAGAGSGAGGSAVTLDTEVTGTGFAGTGGSTAGLAYDGGGGGGAGWRGGAGGVAGPNGSAQGGQPGTSMYHTGHVLAVPTMTQFVAYLCQVTFSWQELPLSNPCFLDAHLGSF